MTYFCTATRVTPQNLTVHAHHCERPVHFQPVSPHTHEKKSNKDKKLKKSTPTHRENGKWEYGNTGAESHKLPQPTAHSPQPTESHRVHRLLQSPDYKNSKGSSTWTSGHRRVNPSLLRLRSESHLSADERTPTHNPPTPPSTPSTPSTQHTTLRTRIRDPIRKR